MFKTPGAIGPRQAGRVAMQITTKGLISARMLNMFQQALKIGDFETSLVHHGKEIWGYEARLRAGRASPIRYFRCEDTRSSRWSPVKLILELSNGERCGLTALLSDLRPRRLLDAERIQLCYVSGSNLAQYVQKDVGRDINPASNKLAHGMLRLARILMEQLAPAGEKRMFLLDRDSEEYHEGRLAVAERLCPPRYLQEVTAQAFREIVIFNLAVFREVMGRWNKRHGIHELFSIDDAQKDLLILPIIEDVKVAFADLPPVKIGAIVNYLEGLEIVELEPALAFVHHILVED